MPNYDFECAGCQSTHTITMSIAERSKGLPKCPKCGEDKLRPLISPVNIKTSRKS